VLAGDALTRHGEIELCGAWLGTCDCPALLSQPNWPSCDPRAAGALAPHGGRGAHKRLPKSRARLAPRLVLDMWPVRIVAGGVAQAGSMATRPVVRIDDGRMVHLSGPVPVRDEPASAGLLEKTALRLDLMAGPALDLRGRGHRTLRGQGQTLAGDLAGDGARLLGARVRLEPYAGARSACVGATAFPRLGFDFSFTVVGETEAEQRALGPGPHSVDAATVIRAWEDGFGSGPTGGGGFSALAGRPGSISTAEFWRACSQPSE